MIGHRVVQPAARVEGVLHLAPQDGLDRPDRPTRHHRPGRVHPGERRIVPALADPGLAEPVGVGREPLDGLDVGPRVAPQELLVRGGLRGQARLGADRPKQVDPGSEPPWCQRMARSEVIGHRTWAVHKQHGMAR